MKTCLKYVGYTEGAEYSARDELKLGLKIKKTVTGNARLVIDGLEKGSEMMDVLEATYASGDVSQGLWAIDELY